MNKYAFITMDVESFFDTFCMNKKGIEKDEKYDCSQEVDKFITYLASRNIKATLFVNVSFLPRVKNALIKARELGFDISLHSLEHKPATDFSLEEFKENINKAKSILKEEVGVEPLGFRFPSFKFNDKYMEIIKDEFLYDASYLKTPKGYTKVQDSIYVQDGLYEFPLTRNYFLVKPMVFSGGANLRLLPYKVTMRRMRRNAHRRDSYVLYFHPFELYEGDFPKYKKLNFIQRLYINRNRKVYFQRVKDVIDLLEKEGYNFLTMSEYIKLNNHE